MGLKSKITAQNLTDTQMITDACIWGSDGCWLVGQPMIPAAAPPLDDGPLPQCCKDIACVHQTDPELRERGVYGIGGWLSVSIMAPHECAQRMVPKEGRCLTYEDLGFKMFR